MAVIGREGLRAVAPRTADVECPELGGTLRVRRLSAQENAEIAQMAQAALDDADNKVLRTVEMLAAMVVMAWIDERGVAVVGADDDVRAAIMGWSLETLESITDAISAISSMGKEAAKEAEKNL